MKFFDSFVGKCEKFTTQKILSPLRLPIPPQRHILFVECSKAWFGRRVLFIECSKAWFGRRVLFVECSKAWLGRLIGLKKNSAPVGAEFFGGATRI